VEYIKKIVQTGEQIHEHLSKRKTKPWTFDEILQSNGIKEIKLTKATNRQQKKEITGEVFE
jgi:hypothetical protein